MSAVLGVVTFAVGVVGMDRLGLWAERRGWIHWRRTRGTGAGAGMLSVVDEVVNPASRHSVEEREAKQHTRVEDGTGWGLDLDSRTVYLR